jgi:hypothetical protein
MMDMTEIIRARDCIVFFKADANIVTVDAAMLAGGWPGGQGVQWVDGSADERTVTYSSGYYGGMLVWGSDEPADQWTAMTGQQLSSRTAVMLSGGNIAATSSYERYTLVSRQAHALNPAIPLVPIVYHTQDVLYLSLRGLWTKEDELAITVDPRRPCFFTGLVVQEPKALNSYFLTIQTSF